MALKVPGKLRRIDTNEASAESQLSAEHTRTQGSAIQGYYQRQACLAAATPHFEQTDHWHRPAICFCSCWQMTVMERSAVDFYTFKQLYKAQGRLLSFSEGDLRLVSNHWLQKGELKCCLFYHSLLDLTNLCGRLNKGSVSTRSKNVPLTAG